MNLSRRGFLACIPFLPAAIKAATTAPVSKPVVLQWAGAIPSTSGLTMEKIMKAKAIFEKAAINGPRYVLVSKEQFDDLQDSPEDWMTKEDWVSEEISNQKGKILKEETTLLIAGETITHDMHDIFLDTACYGRSNHINLNDMELVDSAYWEGRVCSFEPAKGNVIKCSEMLQPNFETIKIGNG